MRFFSDSGCVIRGNTICGRSFWRPLLTALALAGSGQAQANTITFDAPSGVEQRRRTSPPISWRADLHLQPDESDRRRSQEYRRLWVPDRRRGTVCGGDAGEKDNNSTRCFDQAATAAAFLFLRQPNKPNALRPEAKSGKAAGSG